MRIFYLGSFCSVSLPGQATEWRSHPELVDHLEEFARLPPENRMRLYIGGVAAYIA
jgi:hypothetical protein